MKFKSNSIAFTIVGCFLAISWPSFAQSPPAYQVPTTPTPSNSSSVSQTGFRCDTSGKNPVTIYQNSQGVQEPWIQWVSDHFSGSGWNPNSRCQEVSSRLETYRKNKQLKFVTLGTVNNQSVICVASQNNGPCEGIVYTLKPGQDGLKALNNLFAWRKGDQGLRSNYESVVSIPYIDVGSRLGNTATQETPVVPATPTVPVTPAAPVTPVTPAAPTDLTPSVSEQQQSPNIHREL